MLIDVTEIHPPKVGGKVSQIVTADGQKYEIFPEKLAGVDVGKRYEVKVCERQFNDRTIRSIDKITPAPAQARSQPSTEEIPQLNAAGEAEYVGRVLAALITSGLIEKTQLATATHWLRNIWRNEHDT